MKWMDKKNQKVVKGMPSAVLLSILIHAALFLLAGMLVVFTVVKKPEKKFVPPPAVERPKMKLKKPRPKIKKTSKPKATTRIVTKMNRANMPDIQLPEMSGMGGGLGGSVDGFEMIPDFEELSFLGVTLSIGSDLEGRFYDFNRRRDGGTYGISTDAFITELAKFVKSGWKSSKISRYYCSPKKLYATTIVVPPIPSPLAPMTFGEPDNMDTCWMVHYKGKLVHKDGIRFRFAGNADDIIVVAVNKKTVFNGSRGWNRSTSRWIDCASWTASSADNRKWIKCHDYTAVGDLIELEPGVPMDIDVMIAEVPGGQFNAFLCVMEEGVEYENNSKGEPILPIFKTGELSRSLQDMIYRGMPANEVCITNGPTFNDYGSSTPESAIAKAVESDAETSAGEADPRVSDTEPSKQRTWTSMNGESFTAKLLAVVAGNAILKTPRGEQKKVPLELFSSADRRDIELSTPPRLELDLGKKTQSRPLKYGSGSVRINEYTFTAKVKQSSVGDYSHNLEVEFFTLGSEIGANQYILLDRGKSSFIPSETEDRSFEFSGRTVDLLDFYSYDMRRGDRYAGFLITVTDERGEIIAHRSTPKWLYKNLDALKQLPIGSFLDDTCTRVWPTPLRAWH